MKNYYFKPSFLLSIHFQIFFDELGFNNICYLHNLVFSELLKRGASLFILASHGVSGSSTCIFMANLSMSSSTQVYDPQPCSLCCLRMNQLLIVTCVQCLQSPLRSSVLPPTPPLSLAALQQSAPRHLPGTRWGTEIMLEDNMKIEWSLLGGVDHYSGRKYCIIQYLVF